MPEINRIQALLERLLNLSESQLIAIENIVAQFERSYSFWRNEDSDLVSDCVLQEFGDTLRLHHCFSAEAFTKDKFEYALEKVCTLCGVRAAMATKGNPGHDITIGSSRFSLKTQADAKISKTTIHISKFMELGKGEWGDKPSDLEGMRERFFHHMKQYDRILTLRRLSKIGNNVYELVEIPKTLLLEAEHGKFTMMFKSKQSPKPGNCTVSDAAGNVKFKLYFDGGSERKLQIQLIDKSLCIVHATWQFEAGAKIDEEAVL